MRRAPNHVPADEWRAFACTVLGMLQAAFPLEDGPTVVTVLRKLAEDAREVDLPVAGRAEATRPIEPILIPAVDAGAAARPELGVFDVKRLDALVIEIDERGVVELLQQEVARVEQNVRALVPADRF